MDKSDVIEEILKETAQASTKLMKLKVSKINLKSERIIQSICDALVYNINLIVLDVSMGQLVAKQLKLLTDKL